LILLLLLLLQHTVIFSPATHTAAQDFAALAACNASIMTTGTFGWWASFLAGGPVVSYAHPMMQLQFDADSYFPHDWMLLEEAEPEPEPQDG
jgi:hypothetical protein